MTPSEVQRLKELSSIKNRSEKQEKEFLRLREKFLTFSEAAQHEALTRRAEFIRCYPEKGRYV